MNKKHFLLAVLFSVCLFTNADNILKKFEPKKGDATVQNGERSVPANCEWTAGRKNGSALRFRGLQSELVLPKPLFDGKTKKLTISFDFKIDKAHKGYWLNWEGTGGLFIRSRGDDEINMGVRGHPWAEVYAPCPRQDQWHFLRLVISGKMMYAFIDETLAGKTAIEDSTFSGVDTVTVSKGWDGFYGVMDNLSIVPEAVFPASFIQQSKAESVVKEDTVKKSRKLLVRNDGKKEWTSDFDVPDKAGYAYGSWVRAEEKFVKNAARAAMTMDENYFHVLIRCPVPSGMVVQKQGDTVWSGDYIEFFLRPDLNSPVYYQYCAGANGKTFTAKYTGKMQADASFRSKAVFNVDCSNPAFYWVSIDIPRSEANLAGKDVDGRVVSGNFCRGGATCGGLSSWQPGLRDFHDVDNFGRMVLGSSEAYWQRQLAEIQAEFKHCGGKSAQRADFAEKLAGFADKVKKSGANFEHFGELSENCAKLRIELISLAVSGKTILIHRPDVWGNRIAPSVDSKPLKKIKLTAAMNSRVLYGFVISNLTDKPFLGFLKCFESLPDPGHFGQENWNDFLRNIKFYEGIPLQITGDVPLYDPLAPLTMKSIFRAPPHTDVPVWMTISTAGLKPGKYTGVIFLKNSYQGFSPESVALELEVLPVDLGKVKIDTFHYAFFTELFVDGKNYTNIENLYRYLTERYTNMLFAGHLREVYPRLNDDGTLQKIDFSSIDKKIQTWLDCGAEREQLKLIFNLHTFIFLWRDKNDQICPANKNVPYGSPKWERAFKEFMKKLYAHLEEKFQLPPERIIIYTGDEPEGDIKDPKSRMHRVWYLGNLVREAVPHAALVTNPVPRKGYDKTYMDGLKILSRQLNYVIVLERFKTPEFIKMFQDAGVTVWTYSVRTTKMAQPQNYRRMYHRSFLENIGTVNAYWAIDAYSGEGFDSKDSNGNDNYTDYGSAYCDMNLGAIISSRRAEAHVQGLLDLKALILCRKLIDQKGNDADRARLKQIEAMTMIGGCDEMDRCHVEILNMICELQKRGKK